jgi:hypothetical protein
MAKQFGALDDQHIKFIKEQHIFFVATAAPDGRVNISPKGGDALRVLGPNRLLWRNLTGSGNETAGHLKKINRMTIMWCSFTTRPLILRAYGSARTIHVDDADCAELDAHFPPHVGARQVYDVSIDMVQSSCGYAVPFMEFREDRSTLDTWSEDRGPDAIKTYWAERNAETIDGFPTK